MSAFKEHHDELEHSEQRFGRDASVGTWPHRAAPDAFVENSADKSRQVVALSAILALLGGWQRFGIAQQREELAPGPEESDGVPHDRRDLIARRGASRQRRANLALQFRKSVDYRRRVQLLFRSELAVDAALADAGVRGDLVDQHEIEFPVGKEFRGALEYSFTQERSRRPAAAVFAANQRRNR